LQIDRWHNVHDMSMFVRLSQTLKLAYSLFLNFRREWAITYAYRILVEVSLRVQVIREQLVIPGKLSRGTTVTLARTTDFNTTSKRGKFKT